MNRRTDYGSPFPRHGFVSFEIRGQLVIHARHFALVKTLCHVNQWAGWKVSVMLWLVDCGLWMCGWWVIRPLEEPMARVIFKADGRSDKIM